MTAFNVSDVADMMGAHAPNIAKLNVFAMQTNLLKGVGLLVTAVGLFGATWALTADPSSFLWRYWARYTSGLERKLRPQFIWTKGTSIAYGQFAALFLLYLAHALFELMPLILGVLTVAIIIGPMIWIERMRQKRVELIETQLDGAILALANALKSIPSIGAAFQSVVLVLPDPTRQEYELAVKEMKVGSTLDQALLHMAARIGSRAVDSALSAILIGRQVGGNLPKVLEQTAASLREMARLEGVVRTKTAEGKAQLWVMALLPGGLCYMLNLVMPGYFKPLTQSLTGYLIILGCGALWVGGLLLARKVLNVDI